MVIVDDEKMILNSLQRELREWAKERNLTIHAANSGEEALDFLKEHHLETVLLMSDQKMPGLKGYELLATCAQDYPQIVLLMLTGYTDINDVVKTIRSGVFSYILKPWDHDDLVYEVTKAYNIFETRNKNAEYLRLIKNELQLATKLETAINRTGTIETAGYTIASAHVSGKTGRKDLATAIPINAAADLLVMGSFATDTVRALLVASTVYARLCGAVAERNTEVLLDAAGTLSLAQDALSDATATMPEILADLAVGVLDRNRHTLTCAFSGSQSWFLLRGNGFAEVGPDGATKAVKLQVGDIVVVPSAVLFPGEDMAVVPKEFAATLVAAHGSDSGVGALRRVVAEHNGGRRGDSSLLSITRNE